MFIPTSSEHVSTGGISFTTHRQRYSYQVTLFSFLYLHVLHIHHKILVISITVYLTYMYENIKVNIPCDAMTQEDVIYLL